MGIFDPQGLPSSPTSQTTTSQGLASWAQPYVSNYLNQAQNLVATQQTPALLNQSYIDAAGLKLPGGFASGSALAEAGGKGSLSTAPIALQYGQQGAQYGAEGTKYGAMGAAMGDVAARAGDLYAQQATNPAAMQQYMSPYMQNVVDWQKKQAIRDYQIQAPQMAAQAVGQGAFGGNRLALQQAEANRGLENRLAGIQAAGTQEAFNQAQQAQQFGAQLGLQGQQVGMQGQQLGLAGLNTAMQGQQLGLQGVSGAQQGYAGATQAGGTLGNIASQQAQAQLAALALKNQFGLQQQQFPYQQAQFLQGMLSGLPVTQQNTQTTQAAPNNLSQALGLGGTLFSTYALGKMSGLFGATGGLPKDFKEKRYAAGGLTAIDREVENNPLAYSQQQLERSAQNGALSGVAKLLAVSQIAKAKQDLQRQQALQAGAQQPDSILAQLQAQAAPTGIETAPSNLPQQFAGGGIIAFDEGGDVPRFYSGGGFEDLLNQSAGIKRGQVSPSLASRLWSKMQGMDTSLGRYSGAVLGSSPAVSSADADAQQGGFYGGPAPLEKPYILDDKAAPKAAPTSGSGAPAGPNITMPSLSYTLPKANTSAEDAAIAEARRLVGGAGEDYEKAQKMAGISALLKASLALGGGASPYFMQNLNAAGQTGLQSWENELQRIQGSKEKQAEKMATLALKHPEMIRAANKLGLEAAETQAKVPYYAANAYESLARGYRALNPIAKTGGAGGLGPLPPAVALKLEDAYKESLANPAGNVAILKQLDTIDPQASRYLLKSDPKTKSYQNAYAQYKKLVDTDYMNTVNKLRVLNTKGSGFLGSEE